MGIFGDILDTFNPFSSDEKSTTQSGKSTSTSTSDISKTGTQSQTQTQTGTKESTAQQTQDTTQEFLRRLLSEDVVGSLEGLIGTLATKTAAQQEQPGVDVDEFTAQLISRASGTQDFIGEAIAGIVGNARVQGERELGRGVTGIQRQAGGAANSLVAVSEALGRAELESRLGDLTGQLQLSGRQLEEQSIQNAISAIAAGSGANTQNIAQIAQLAQVLRGAEETSVSTGETTAQSQAQEQQTLATLVDILSKLNETRKVETEKISSGRGTASDDRDIFDIAQLLLG